MGWFKEYVNSQVLALFRPSYGWLDDASYADLANTAQALGIDVSRQAIEQRMTPGEGNRQAKCLRSNLNVSRC